MGSLTDFSEQALLTHIFNVAYTPPVTTYMALCTADPTDSATGALMNEVANTGGYARVAITFGAATSRRVTQNALVTFPTSTAGWGTVTHWAIVDSATYGAGNVLATGAFSPTKSIVTNNTPSVPTSTIYIEFSAGVISNYLANKWLDLQFRNTAFAKPATYITLTTAIVLDSDTGSTITEPSGNAYARKQVNINGGTSPSWTAASGSSLNNFQQIDFATATGSWGLIVAATVVDAATVGNLLIYDNGITDQTVDTNDTVSFPASTFVVSAS